MESSCCSLTRVHVVTTTESLAVLLSMITVHMFPPTPSLQPPVAQPEESEQQDSEEVQSPLKTPPPKPAPLQMEEAATCITPYTSDYFINAVLYTVHLLLMHAQIFVLLGHSCTEKMSTRLCILALIFLFVSVSPSLLYI